MEDESKQIPLRFSASEIIVGEKCRFETFELNRMGNTQNHKKGSSSSNEIKDDNKEYSFCGEEPVEVINLSTEEKLVSMLEFLPLSGLAISSPRPLALTSSSEFAATNNISHPAIQYQSASTASQSEMANTREPSNRAGKDTSSITLEDVSKREHGAKSIGAPNKPVATIPNTKPTIAHMMLHLRVRQDVMSVTLKVTYRNKIIKFLFPRTSEIIKLKEEVSKRLNLHLGSFDIEYKDEEGDWILMNCNEDLRNHLQLFCSKGDQVVRLRAVDSDEDLHKF